MASTTEDVPVVETVAEAMAEVMAEAVVWGVAEHASTTQHQCLLIHDLHIALIAQAVHPCAGAMLLR